LSHYEYVAVYVDDLMIAMKDPQTFVALLQLKYKFKLKGTGPIEYHIGMDFTQDADSILCISPKKYIEKMMDTYKHLFGEKPSTKCHSPIEHGDHPKLDTT
jgi:hypothetical protein